MEIILIQDVKSLGKKGEVVKVSDGYARNFILPKKLGIEATKQNLHELSVQKAAEERRLAQMLSEAEALSEKLKGIQVKVEIKAGEGGKAFGSVSAREISSALKEQFGFDIDKKKIVLPEPIKNAGSYTIGIKLHQKVTAKVSILVEAV
jgi:large subunit ribosomal protein L9